MFGPIEDWQQEGDDEWPEGFDDFNEEVQALRGAEEVLDKLG